MITNLTTNQLYLLQKSSLGKPYTNKDIVLTCGNSARILQLRLSSIGSLYLFHVPNCFQLGFDFLEQELVTDLDKYNKRPVISQEYSSSQFFVHRSCM